MFGLEVFIVVNIGLAVLAHQPRKMMEEGSKAPLGELAAAVSFYGWLGMDMDYTWVPFNVFCLLYVQGSLLRRPGCVRRDRATLQS